MRFVNSKIIAMSLIAVLLLLVIMVQGQEQSTIKKIQLPQLGYSFAFDQKEGGLVLVDAVNNTITLLFPHFT